MDRNKSQELHTFLVLCAQSLVLWYAWPRVDDTSLSTPTVSKASSQASPRGSQSPCNSPPGSPRKVQPRTVAPHTAAPRIATCLPGVPQHTEQDPHCTLAGDLGHALPELPNSVGGPPVPLAVSASEPTHVPAVAVVHDDGDGIDDAHHEHSPRAPRSGPMERLAGPLLSHNSSSVRVHRMSTMSSAYGGGMVGLKRPSWLEEHNLEMLVNNKLS